jgi:hypothetical protein
MLPRLPSVVWCCRPLLKDMGKNAARDAQVTAQNTVTRRDYLQPKREVLQVLYSKIVKFFPCNARLHARNRMPAYRVRKPMRLVLILQISHRSVAAFFLSLLEAIRFSFPGLLSHDNECDSLARCRKASRRTLHSTKLRISPSACSSSQEPSCNCCRSKKKTDRDCGRARPFFFPQGENVQVSQVAMRTLHDGLSPTCLLSSYIVYLKGNNMCFSLSLFMLAHCFSERLPSSH